jgi:hypothetical protein
MGSRFFAFSQLFCRTLAARAMADFPQRNVHQSYAFRDREERSLSPDRKWPAIERQASTDGPTGLNRSSSAKM